MKRPVAIALLSLLIAGAGCGSCVDDQNNQPPPPPGTPLKLPVDKGNIHRVEHPLPRMNLIGVDAGAGAEGPDVDAGTD